MRRLACILLTLAFILPAREAAGDILYLANGRSMEGKVEKVPGGYKITTDAGSSVIDREDVVKHVVKPLPHEEYKIKLMLLDKGNFDAQMKLAQWCKDKHLDEKADLHYQEAMNLKPDDPKARKENGYIRNNGKWVKREEFMRRRGMKLYKGRWIPIADAERKERDDEREKRTRQTFESAWKVIRTAAKERKESELPRYAQTLYEMGPLALSAIRNGAIDCSSKARKASFMALGMFTCVDSLKILMDRLRRERSQEMGLLAATQLVKRKDKDNVIRELLDRSVYGRTKRFRKRCAMTLRAIGDTSVIPSLISVVDFCPTAPDEPDDDEEDTAPKPGTSRTVTQTPGIKRTYPANEALEIITGQWMPPNREVWGNWWKRVKDDFKLTPPPGFPLVRD